MLHNVDMVAARSKLAAFRGNLVSLQRKLEEGKRLNREREELQRKLSDARKLRQQTATYVGALNKLQKRFITEDLEYKDRRLAFVSKLITDNVAAIFPFEGFTVSLLSDFKYKSSRTHLRITDRNNRKRLPHINEGKLMQELISYSSALGINESSGCYILYADEALAASDQDNLGKIAELTRNALDKGIQIIMIEQSENGYKNLPRREFHLEKDHVNQRTVLVNVIDI